MRWRTIGAIARQTAMRAYQHDVTGLAGDLAFRFFLALFPFFIFLAAVGGYIATSLDVANPAEKIVNSIGTALPADAADIVDKQLQQVINVRNTSLLSIGIIGTLIAASNGFNALYKAFNRAYGVPETRPLWKRWLFSLALTIFAGTSIVLAFTLFVFGELFGFKLIHRLGIESQWRTLLTMARWSVGAVLVLGAVTLLYRTIPNLRVPLRWVLPGALLFAATWALASYLFALYLAWIASYNATYGALAGAAILLVWFYLTALILLVGVELNATIDEWLDPNGVERERRATLARSLKTVPRLSARSAHDTARTVRR